MARPRNLLPSAASVMALTDHEGRLAVRATPNAGSDAVVLPKPGEAPVLLVRITATPEDGRANEAILALLAKVLGRPRSALSLLRGATSKDKLIRISPE